MTNTPYFHTCVTLMLRAFEKIEADFDKFELRVLKEVNFTPASLRRHAKHCERDRGGTEKIADVKKEHCWSLTPPAKDAEKLYKLLRTLLYKAKIAFEDFSKTEAHRIESAKHSDVVQAKACKKSFRKLAKSIGPLSKLAKKGKNDAAALLDGKLNLNKRKRVFIGSSKESLGIAKKVRRELSHEFSITLWTDSDVFKPGSVTISKLEEALLKFDFAVFVCAADDQLIKRGKKFHVTRDNVLFEFGLFMGKLGSSRVFFLKDKQVALPSDLEGVGNATYDSADCDESGVPKVETACDDIARACNAL